MKEQEDNYGCIVLTIIFIVAAIIFLVPKSKAQELEYEFDTDPISSFYNSDSSLFFHGDSVMVIKPGLYTIPFEAPKDTFIEVSENVWYNEKTWTTIDSTSYYHTISVVVDMWHKYEKECYNDSIEDCGYHFVEDNKWGDMSVGHEEYFCKWIHATPTIYGFMEFIETKSKKLWKQR